LKRFLSIEEKGFSGNTEGRNTGTWWSLAAEFISLSEMIFTLMLKMEEFRELGRRKSLKMAPPRS
jgi:hypothetical protein